MSFGMVTFVIDHDADVVLWAVQCTAIYTGRKHHSLVHVPLQPHNKSMYMQMTVTVIHCQHIV